MLCAVLCWPVPRGLAGPPRRPPPAQPSPADQVELSVPVVLELVCGALEAGLPTSTAVGAVLSVTGGPELEGQLLAAGFGPAGTRQRSDVVPLRWRALVRALDLADRTGASAAVLLRGAAYDERARRRGRVRAEAARLGVRLVLPLGLTVLPAFVLLGIAPVVIGLASAVLGP
jgi:tight adherence protein B